MHRRCGVGYRRSRSWRRSPDAPVGSVGVRYGILWNHLKRHGQGNRPAHLESALAGQGLSGGAVVRLRFQANATPAVTTAPTTATTTAPIATRSTTRRVVRRT